MGWDFPVEGRLFVVALVLIFLGLFPAAFLASQADPGNPNAELSWYATFMFGAGVLLIFAYLYGRTAEERARARRPASP